MPFECINNNYHYYMSEYVTYWQYARLWFLWTVYKWFDNNWSVKFVQQIVPNEWSVWSDHMYCGIAFTQHSHSHAWRTMYYNNNRLPFRSFLILAKLMNIHEKTRITDRNDFTSEMKRVLRCATSKRHVTNADNLYVSERCTERVHRSDKWYVGARVRLRVYQCKVSKRMMPDMFVNFSK